MKHSFLKCELIASGVTAILLCLFADPCLAIAQMASGKSIYSKQCASCHGDQGQGTDEYFSDPLQGDLSLNQLTQLINDTMPEGAAEECVGEDAENVSKFIFDNFYSRNARLKREKPKIELARLTVRQYQESVADLIGSFTHQPKIPNERGLKANYFAARGWSKKRQLAKQVDKTIDFGQMLPHFDPTRKYPSLQPKPKPGQAAAPKQDRRKKGDKQETTDSADAPPNNKQKPKRPAKKEKKKKKLNPASQGFSAFWSGSILAPETGYYEIAVESKNGFELFFNGNEDRFIDQIVSSSEQLAHKKSIFLLGGRMYPLKLHLYAGREQTPAARLLWKPPGGQLHVIPNQSLVPILAPEVAVVSTTFPADDASAGYPRGTSVSKQWDAATTAAAIEIANWIAKRAPKLANVERSDDDSEQKVRELCYQFTERAFTTPLNKDDRQFFVDQFFDQPLSIRDKIKRAVMVTLKSPRFLYPSLQRRTPENELARRMALQMWDSLPNQQLIRFAKSGKLASNTKIREALNVMVDDPRSRQKLKSFFHFWLDSETIAQTSKDNQAFPDFDQQLLADLKHSLELYLDAVVWNQRSDFRELFLADYLFVNDRLAKFYGLETDSKEFKKVKITTDRRAGILTHPYLMSGLAYDKDSSPIHRGVFVAKQLLGRHLRQPPDDVKPLDEEFNPEMTTRERVEHQTKPATCMGCHTVINPLGFCLENFDAVGRYRTEEKDKQIAAASVYKTPDGLEVELRGAKDLAEFLVESKSAQRNFIRQLFRHYAKQSVDAYGENQLEQLHQQFIDNKFNVRKLLIDIAMVVVTHDLDEVTP